MRASHAAAECAVAFPNAGAPWAVERGQLMQAKGRWAQRMLQVNDVARLAPLIRVVEQTYEAANSKRSEEHTSELQSLMRISYAVVCLKYEIKKPLTLTNHVSR